MPFMIGLDVELGSSGTYVFFHNFAKIKVESGDNLHLEKNIDLLSQF